jgi:SAM-dependent methyltransferase
VDIVASAVDLEQELYKIGMLGQFDYICSSHNFEHLPDPLKFLKNAGIALKHNGWLSMAIPNKIHTFDFTRSLTSTKDFLKFYFEKQIRPDPYTVFDGNSSFVTKINDEFKYNHDLKQSYNELLKNINDENYIDAHVTVYTPESFINIFNDLMILNLIPFEIKEIKVAQYF